MNRQLIEDKFPLTSQLQTVWEDMTKAFCRVLKESDCWDEYWQAMFPELADWLRDAIWLCWRRRHVNFSIVQQACSTAFKIKLPNPSKKIAMVEVNVEGRQWIWEFIHDRDFFGIVDANSYSKCR